MTSKRVAEQIAAEFAKRRQRFEGGQLCVYDPVHPLARKSGWLSAARWVLTFRWELEGVEKPRCEVPECGRRIAFSRRRWQRQKGLPAAATWFLDRDPGNLDARNVVGVCASCAMRGHMEGRTSRDESGRFVATHPDMIVIDDLDAEPGAVRDLIRKIRENPPTAGT